MESASNIQDVVLPAEFKKYFWDCDFQELRMSRHAVFIAERILNFGDLPAVQWLLTVIDKPFLRQVVEHSRNLDPKTRNFWNMICYGRDDNGLLNEVRISFFQYRYPLIQDLHPYHHLAIADMFDLALMKLEAISGRGSKKDFIDFYFLLQYFSLEQLFEQYEVKYGIKVSNHYHLLKSLVYFKDAESQPMPIMSRPISWDHVKARIFAEIKKVKLV